MSIIFESTLEVQDLNTAGKKFERVNRLHCVEPGRSINVVLDVNCELFDAKAEDVLQMALATSISSDGRPDDGLYDSTAKYDLMDDYDYVMHGRLFALKHIDNQNMEIQVSFGGLLLRVQGPQALMEPFTLDMM